MLDDGWEMSVVKNLHFPSCAGRCREEQRLNGIIEALKLLSGKRTMK